MIIGRPGPPTRVTLVHRDAQRAEAIAAVLRRLGHRVTVIVSGRQLERSIIDSAPGLLIGSASFGNPDLGPVFRAVRQALPEIPAVVLTSPEAPPGALFEADATVREPPLPGELEVCIGGLLHRQGEARGLKQKVRELLGLYKMSWGFSLKGGPAALFGHLAKEAAQLLKANKGLVLLFDAERRMMRAQLEGYGLTPGQVERSRYLVDSEATSRWNFRKNGPLLSNKARGDSRLMPDLVEELDLGAALLVPMTRGPQVIGVILVADRPGGQPFGDEDLNLLVAAAGEAAVAVENLRLHEELKRANERLTEFDRVKSEFVAIVAHDFRRPLMAIRGFAELVLEEPGLPEESRQEYLRTVIAETDGLAALANDTLLISRIETGDFQFAWSEIDLGPFILKAVPLGLSDHSVLLDIPADFPKIVGDAARLSQVLTNLVNNAIKYSPSGGSITVRCRERGPLHVAIEVADTGLGIPEDQIPALFQKFQRVRTDQHLAIPGTGLGLYICRLIVEGHGGQVWAESELGKGSTFGLVIPLDARAAHEERARHRDKPQAERELSSAGAEAEPPLTQP